MLTLRELQIKEIQEAENHKLVKSEIPLSEYNIFNDIIQAFNKQHRLKLTRAKLIRKMIQTFNEQHKHTLEQ